MVMDQTSVEWKKGDASSTFYWKYISVWVSSNDIKTIKINKKNLKNCKKSQENKQTKKIIQNKNLGCQMDIRETNSNYQMEKI